jgi:hypothetical protein
MILTNRLKNLFQQIQDDRAFAVTGGQPYGDAMIVNIAFTFIFNTGLFHDNCRARQARAVADKTRMTLKRDFAVAHWEFCLMNRTAHQSGLHSANMIIEQGLGEIMQDTGDAIAQLATAMASDRITMATLTATNAKLAMQLEAAQSYINTLKEEAVALKSNIKLT